MLIILVFNLLASSPLLHERLHPDASKTGHECAVTHFIHGHIDAAVVDVAAAIPFVPYECHFLNYSSFNGTLVDTLPPGRGPPVSLLHS